MSVTITHPTIDELQETLHLAFSHMAPRERDVRIGAILGQKLVPSELLDGVFQAHRDGRRVGALFSQLRPDGTVTLWPPAMIDDVSPEPFFEPLSDFCRRTEAKAAMALADLDQKFDETCLLRVGKFEYLSDLLYLVATLDEKDRTDGGDGEIDFVPMSRAAGDSFERMVAAVWATYYRTKDFPRLIGVMPVGDVLRGYRDGGVFDPDIWYFVQKDGEDVGVLLLTDQPEDQLELTYMGLVEGARRQGLARPIIRRARHAAALRNRAYLLTSVDEQNTAALKSYLAEGFQAWDRKKVYARFFD